MSMWGLAPSLAIMMDLANLKQSSGMAAIGANTALVAPVKIGAGAIVGAGSTITADVPNDAIATTRSALDVRHGAAVRYRKIRNEQS